MVFFLIDISRFSETAGITLKSRDNSQMILSDLSSWKTIKTSGPYQTLRLCVLRSKMDLSPDVSPAVAYLEKNWEEIYLCIIFYLSCTIFLCWASQTKGYNIWRGQLPIAPTKHWHQNCGGHHLCCLLNSALLCQGPSLFFFGLLFIYFFF